MGPELNNVPGAFSDLLSEETNLRNNLSSVTGVFYEMKFNQVCVVPV